MPNLYDSILTKRKPLRRGPAVAAGGSAVALGVATLAVILAAGSFAASNLASGTLGGNAHIVTASGTSGGQAVQFTTPPPSFTVVGNLIKDQNGNAVNIHGVDRPSLEWSCTGQAAQGGTSGIPASDFTTMRSNWNANAVRLAVSEDRWLPGTAGTCSGYQSTVETAVTNALSAGLIVIIDLHWSDQGNNNTTSGQQCMPDANSVTFWTQVASHYKTNPNVWFELYNEPYPPGANQTAQWNTWQNGGTVTCTATVGGGSGTWNAPGMQTLVNTVRATGASNIVLAGGLAYSSVLGGVPPLTGGNVVYAVHPYENTSDPNGSTDGSWDYNFGNQSAKAPVIATEFGDMSCGDATYDNAILSYFHAHSVGYTAWAWFAGGCSFPSLITDNAGDCVSTMGCTIQADMKRQN